MQACKKLLSFLLVFTMVASMLVTVLPATTAYAAGENVFRKLQIKVKISMVNRFYIYIYVILVNRHFTSAETGHTSNHNILH